jgi:hypothetical protein
MRAEEEEEEVEEEEESETSRWIRLQKEGEKAAVRVVSPVSSLLLSYWPQKQKTDDAAPLKSPVKVAVSRHCSRFCS